MTVSAGAVFQGYIFLIIERSNIYDFPKKLRLPLQNIHGSIFINGLNARLTFFVFNTLEGARSLYCMCTINWEEKPSTQ